MAYIYDPSQQISQSLGKAAKGVGNIFAQVIAEKQQDFQLAQDAEANIQALKKNLNMYSNKVVTDKSNALLDDMRNTIFKDGKLDYSKLREVKDKVSDINDLKQGYQVAADEFQRRLELGIATKDDMMSFTNYYNDLSKLMGDENLIKNPRDLSVAMQNAYYKNLDESKVARKVLGSQLGGVQKMSGNTIRKNSKGQEEEVKYAADTYGKFVYNPATNKMEASPDVNWDNIAQNIETSSPEFMKMAELKYGAGTSFMSKGQLIKYIAEQTAGTPIFELTPEYTVRKEKAQAAGAELDVKIKNQELVKLKKEIQNLSGGITMADPSGSLYDPNLTGLQTKKRLPVSAIDFGRNMKMTQDGKQLNILGFGKNKANGEYWAKVLKPKSSSNIGAGNLQDVSLGGSESNDIGWVRIKDPNAFVKSMRSQLIAGGLDKNDAAFIGSALNTVISIPRELQVTSKPKQKSNSLGIPSGYSIPE